MPANRGNLRYEKSQNHSGVLFHDRAIPLLKEQNYYVKDYKLDGDAPKQFIKAYFYEQDSTVKKASSSSWNSYIAKTAEKWYPHESVIEFMINRVGQVLGLHINEIKLVRANNQIRFLSEYFLRKGEILVHGAEICGQHLGDMMMAEEIANNRKTARELFTFEFIKDSIRTVFPGSFEQLLCDLVKMIGFDALVGNNDRHFYNWGVIDTLKKTGQKPVFAPIYDSARALLWNYSDDNLVNLLDIHKKGHQKVVHYIENASPRISIEGNTKANHFELIDFIKRYNTEYQQIINQLAGRENEQRVLATLKDEFYPFFTQERRELMTIILQARFEKIRSI